MQTSNIKPMCTETENEPKYGDDDNDDDDDDDDGYQCAVGKHHHHHHNRKLRANRHQILA